MNRQLKRVLLGKNPQRTYGYKLGMKMARIIYNLGQKWDRWLEYSRAKRQVEEQEFLLSKNYSVPAEDMRAAQERLRKATEARQAASR